MKQKTREPVPEDNVLFAFRIIFGLMCLVFLCLGIRQFKLEGLYQSEGTIASGIISAKRVEERNGIDRETKRPTVTKTHFLTLQFQTAKGQSMEVEIAVPSSRWETTDAPSPVTVEYLFNEPTKCRIAGETQVTGAYVMTGLGGLGVLSGLSALVGRLRKR